MFVPWRQTRCIFTSRFKRRGGVVTGSRSIRSFFFCFVFFVQTSSPHITCSFLFSPRDKQAQEEQNVSLAVSRSLRCNLLSACNYGNPFWGRRGGTVGWKAGGGEEVTGRRAYEMVFFRGWKTLSKPTCEPRLWSQPEPGVALRVKKRLPASLYDETLSRWQREAPHVRTHSSVLASHSALQLRNGLLLVYRNAGAAFQ